MQIGKVEFKRLRKRELERLGKLMNGISNSTPELINAVEIMVKNHGLVFFIGFPIIYTSHGEHGNYNWESVLSLYYGKEFYEYRKNYLGVLEGFGELSLKAFETYQTYVSTNVSELIPATLAQSCLCLGMCLKNIKIDAESHDFAFEMMFKLDDDNIRQPFVFLDSMFTELEECLPSFKLSSGAKISRQSLVLDSHTYKAFEEHQLSSPLYYKLHSDPQFNTLDLKADTKAAWEDELFPLIKYEDKDGLEHAIVAIKKAISTLAETHGLTFCQVWTHHDPSGDKGLDSNYSMGARNCEDVGIQICLKNTNTVDLDYAFQFFFSKSIIINKHFCEFFDSVLFTLAKNVPSFKLSSSCPQFDRLLLQADSVIASVDELSSSEINCLSVSASVKIAHMKTEFSKLFHPVVVSKNATDIDISTNTRLTYYSSSQLTRPLWIELESDQDLKMCIDHCKTNKITHLPIRVVQSHTSKRGFYPRAARHAALVISPDEA